MEMRCSRRLLDILYKDHITNSEVKSRIFHRTSGCYEDILATIKRRKLQWYRHVTRSTGFSKTILQGTVSGGRRRDKQPNR